MTSLESSQNLKKKNKKNIDVIHVKGVELKKLLLKSADIQEKISIYNDSNKNIDLNNTTLMANVDNLQRNPMIHLDTVDFSKNDVYKQYLQMEEDYKSISMQQKFLIVLGGITITSLIITNYYL